MKKVSLILLAAFVISFTPPKEWTVSLTPEKWDKVLKVINQSTSPHNEVLEVQQMIIPPLLKQQADTSKPKK